MPRALRRVLKENQDGTGTGPPKAKFWHARSRPSCSASPCPRLLGAMGDVVAFPPPVAPKRPEEEAPLCREIRQELETILDRALAIIDRLDAVAPERAIKPDSERRQGGGDA